MIIRFFLPLIQVYIEFYQKFENPLLEEWTEKIKPWILEKYKKSSSGIFTENSDIHFMIDIIDKLKAKYAVKIQKNKKTKNVDNLQSLPPIPEKNEEDIKSKIDKNKKELKNITQNKKVEINEKEEDIKQLRINNMEKINSFLLDFMEDNELQKKRANSMMSLRHSKTISSYTTCDDSSCLEEIKDGKFKINLNFLIVDNSEINSRQSRTKDIVQKSRKLYQENLGRKTETRETKKKFGTIAGMQPNMKLTFQLKMYPKYNEIEDENEKMHIEYKNKIKLLSISADLLLKKIIFNNFIKYNASLIYHFCQQSFCFLNTEIFFKKLFHCYKTNKSRPLNELKNLIEFINILIIEMFEYYDKVNYGEMQIILIKKFYNELISDLITNFKEDNMENTIEVNEIKENDNINSNRIFRFDSFDFKEENLLFNDYVLNKKNILNMNLNFNVKKINIFISEDKKELNDKNKVKTKINTKKQEKTSEVNNNKKSIPNSKSSEINIGYPKFYKISRTLKRPYNLKYANKAFNKIEGEIKEENSEDGLNSSSSEENKENHYYVDDLNNKEKSSTDIINNLLNKVFNKNTNMISEKEEIMNQIYYISSLLDISEGQLILPNDISEAKSEMTFYSSINSRKKNIFEDLKRPSSLSLSRTRSCINTFSIRSRSNAPNFSLKNYFCITDWNPEDIGDKLTQVSKSLLNRIKPRELLRGIYLKKEKNITSPNVVNCINNFNKLTSFIIEDVISYDTPKLRARTYESWVQVCDYCKTIRNYNDCLAIYSALNNYIITGLNLTLKEIKSKTKSLFETISKFCTVEDNYKNIRNDMLICAQDGDSFIPYLGMLLRDINFLEESSKYINEKGLINMEKIEKMNNLLEKYFNYKKDEKKKFIGRRIPNDLNFLEKLEIIQEEDLENRANNIEPEFKYMRPGTKTLTNIDKKYFQKNNRKRNSISEGTFGFNNLLIK